MNPRAKGDKLLVMYIVSIHLDTKNMIMQELGPYNLKLVKLVPLMQENKQFK